MARVWAGVLCSMCVLSAVGAEAAGPTVSFDSHVSTQTVRLRPRTVVRRTTILSNLRLAYGSGLYLRERSQFGADGSDATFGAGFEGSCFGGFSCHADSVVQAFQSYGRGKLAIMTMQVDRVFRVAGGDASVGLRLSETFQTFTDRNRRIRFDTGYTRGVYGVPLHVGVGFRYNRMVGHVYVPIALSAEFAQIVLPNDTHLALSFGGSVIVPYVSHRPERQRYTVGLRLQYSW